MTDLRHTGSDSTAMTPVDYKIFDFEPVLKPKVNLFV